MILNLETFGAPTMIGRNSFESLLLMLARRDVGAVRVDGEDYKSYLSIAASRQNKHFSADLASLPMCSSHQWARSWINATRGGKGHDSKFMPGLKFGSVEYYYLVYLALRAAYFAGRFTEQEQKALTIELHTPIGAADGKIVTKIRFYCTSPNAVHIRPDERQDFDVELKKSYVPGLHEFDMEFGLGN